MAKLKGARIVVSTVIPADPRRIWADVRNISSHVEWMADAVAITFTSQTHEGPGTTFDCATKVGPLKLVDQMVVTEWTDDEVMGIRHVGLVTGTGRFTLDPVGDGSTRFTWDERLVFPWWMGGSIGALVGGRVLRIVWKRNLRNLRSRFA